MTTQPDKALSDKTSLLYIDPLVRGLCSDGRYDEAIALADQIADKSLVAILHEYCIEHRERRMEIDGAYALMDWHDRRDRADNIADCRYWLLVVCYVVGMAFIIL